MIRGTTAQFKFNLPYVFKDLIYAEIIFWQKGDSFSDAHSVIITKDINSCSGDRNKKEVYVSLTQSDTLKFSDKKHGYVQFRGKVIDGNVFASKQESFIVYPVVSDDILGEVNPPTDHDNDGWVIVNGGSVGG